MAANKKRTQQQARYDNVTVYVRKGVREQLREYVAQNTDAKSLNSFILQVLEERTGMKLDLDNDIPHIAEAMEARRVERRTAEKK